MNLRQLCLVSILAALTSCSTQSQQSGSTPSSGTPANSQPTESQSGDSEPLPQVAAAKSLTAEIIWSHARQWMTGTRLRTKVQPLSDGSIILAGHTEETITLGEGDSATEIVGHQDCSGYHPWLARFDTDGELIWAKRIAGKLNNSITITSDDAIIVTGTVAAHEIGDNGVESTRVFGADTPEQTEVTGCEPLFERYRRENPEKTWDVEQWGPSDVINGEVVPMCDIMFVARYDSDGNFEWVRTGHNPSSVYLPDVVALPDGSVVARFTFTGVTLLDAGTPSEQFLPLAPKYNYLHVPFLIRYQPDGSIDWVEQLSPDDEFLQARPFPIDDDSIAIVGWSGSYLGTYDPDEDGPPPPAYSLSAVDHDGNPLWNIHLDVQPETYKGRSSTPDEIDQFSNGDLLITFDYRFRDATELSQDGETLHETTSNPITEERETARIQYALRVTPDGTIRWLIPTVQAQRDAGRAKAAAILAMDDGSWLAVGGPEEGDTDYVIAPGQDNERRMEDGEGTFVARFLPDGRLDTFLDPPDISDWFPSSRRRLPDGSYVSVRDDLEINPDVPTPALSRIRLELEY
jgi:hypothetical protein